ncbi:hypothetical protein SAMN05660971_01474 [Halomonas cupida]|uniref:Uncharacterized protein n=1 Tax=Halomonas cupida TaxID=44933 RepID=A0A1M7DUC7_9GAMM|nr:hypothetical protein SAMN05660971_01474 [Halomonas cupida]
MVTNIDYFVATNISTVTCIPPHNARPCIQRSRLCKTAELQNCVYSSPGIEDRTVQERLPVPREGI